MMMGFIVSNLMLDPGDLMKRIIYTLLLVLVLTSCDSKISNEKNDNESEYLNPIFIDEETAGFKKFLSKLEDYGYETGYDTPDASEMLGTQRNLELSEGRLVVFEYNKSREAKFDASNLSEDGFGYTKKTQYGVTYIGYSWLEPVHYYVYKNLVVRCCDNDQELLDALEKICGKQINLELGRTSG